MKKILVVHHAKGVNEFQINDFIAQVPEQHRIGYEIEKKQFEQLPTGNIYATPTTMKQRGVDLINKKL